MVVLLKIRLLSIDKHLVCRRVKNMTWVCSIQCVISANIFIAVVWKKNFTIKAQDP